MLISILFLSFIFTLFFLSCFSLFFLFVHLHPFTSLLLPLSSFIHLSFSFSFSLSLHLFSHLLSVSMIGTGEDWGGWDREVTVAFLCLILFFRFPDFSFLAGCCYFYSVHFINWVPSKHQTGMGGEMMGMILKRREMGGNHRWVSPLDFDFWFS